MLVALLALLAQPRAAYGQSFGRDENRFWSFHFENDTWYDTDQSYTNGVRLSRGKTIGASRNRWWTPDGFLRKHFGTTCAQDDQLCWEWTGGWGAGQNMYSPQDIRNPAIIPDDRPYGGWLYLSNTLFISRPDVGDRKEYRATQHMFELALGVTGDWSFAEEVQTFVHEHIAVGAPEPQGWAHQIGNGPGVLLQYAGKTRAFDVNIANRRAFDLLPEWTISAGNIFTQAGGGVTARFGWNLGSDFGPTRIAPVVPMMARESDFEVYGFSAIGARAVAHNVFLDGRWFADDAHTVTREPVVADAELGAFARYKRVGFSARWVRRTPEFTERRIYQEYGALNLILLF